MRVRSRPLAGLLAGSLAVLGLGVVLSNVADAAQPKPGHNRLVPSTPRTDVPLIKDGEITDLEVIGSRVFVAGSFTSISNVGGSALAQPWLAAYNIDTKKVDTTFRPKFDGAVASIKASPDGTALYAVGSFNTVGGVAKKKIVKLNPTTGAAVSAFTANANGRGTAIAVSSNAVYVGGQFTKVNSTNRSGLVALNPTTGAVDTAFNLPLSGGIGVGGMLTVQELKLTHDDKKLLVVHTGRQIAGQDRYGVGLIDTAAKSLLPWRTRLWEDNLSFVGGIQRVFAGDIAPNDSYFVVTSGSGGDRPPINDTAMAFPVSGNDNVEPLWVSRMFDSVYSVAITEVAVYVGGHFSWQESPTANVPWPGLDNVGYGFGQGLSGYSLGDQVVRRDHIGALDPKTGTALEWNPGSNSYEGEKAMLATSRGLLVGGDGNAKGGKTVGRVGFFDLSQTPAATAVDTTITAPIEGQIKNADQSFEIKGGAVASAGVTKVQVGVQNRSSKKWLQDDLRTWGSSNTVEATVASVNATSTSWSLSLSLPAAEYLVEAKTLGRNSTSDPTKAAKKFETFSLDDLPPTTAITAPARGLLAATSFTATGTATDDKGVNALSLSMRNLATNQYLQDDGSVGPTNNTFRVEPDVVGATAATWSYDITLPAEGEWRLTATAIDTAGQSDMRGATRDWTVSTTAVPPTVTITSPVAMTPPTAAGPLTVEPGKPITFAGTASDEDKLKSVEVYLRNTSTRESLATDGTWSADSVAGYYRVSPANLDATSYNWSFTTVPLTPGIYDFRVRATDNLDLVTATANQGRLSVTAQVSGDAFPNGTLSFTGVDQNVDALHLNLSGTATDDRGVKAVRVALRDLDTGRYVQPNRSMAASFATIEASLGSPDSTSTPFALSLDLPTKGEYAVEAWAVDTSNQLDSSTIGATARYLVYPGDADPTLVSTLFLPANGAVFTDSKIVASGRATDDVGISKVEISIVNGAGEGMTSTGVFRAGPAPWVSAFLTSPGTAGSNYAYTSPAVPAGGYTLTVRAVDSYGQVQQTPTVVSVTVN